MPEPQRASADKPAFVFVVAVALFTAALFYLRFGYEVGISDQDEFVPLIMSWMDPDLLGTDWFVQLQHESFSIRHFFAGIIAALHFVMPLNYSLLLVHIVTFFVLVYSLVSISYSLYRNELASLAFVILSVVVTSRMNPGGNDIVHALLVPSSVSWALGLCSFAFVLQNKNGTAGWLLAAATLVHPLVGLQIGSIVVVAHVAAQRPKLARLVIPFMLAGISMVVLFLGLGSSSAMQQNILTHIRAPHHYLIGYTSPKIWVVWISMTLIGALFGFKYGNISLRGFFTFRSNSATTNVLDNHVLTGYFFGISVAIVVLSSVLIGLFPGSLVTKLQPLNVSVLVRVTSLLLISGGVLRLFAQLSHTSWWNDWIAKWTGAGRNQKNPLGRISRFMTSGFLTFSVIFFWITVVWFHPFLKGTSNSAFSDRIDSAVAQWIELETPPEALFVIPPMVTGFQYHTKRSQFVNFKAFPFSEELSKEWLRRLQLIAPVDQLSPGGSALLARFQHAFLNLPSPHFYSLNQSEGVDYIVIPMPLPPSWTQRPATFCSSHWCVFDLTLPPTIAP